MRNIIIDLTEIRLKVERMMNGELTDTEWNHLSDLKKAIEKTIEKII